jgi:hypothetical protein
MTCKFKLENYLNRTIIIVSAKSDKFDVFEISFENKIILTLFLDHSCKADNEHWRLIDSINEK